MSCTARLMRITTHAALVIASTSLLALLATVGCDGEDLSRFRSTGVSCTSAEARGLSCCEGDLSAESRCIDGEMKCAGNFGLHPNETCKIGEPSQFDAGGDVQTRDAADAATADAADSGVEADATSDASDAGAG